MEIFKIGANSLPEIQNKTGSKTTNCPIHLLFRLLLTILPTLIVFSVDNFEILLTILTLLSNLQPNIENYFREEKRSSKSLAEIDLNEK